MGLGLGAEENPHTSMISAMYSELKRRGVLDDDDITPEICNGLDGTLGQQTV